MSYDWRVFANRANMDTICVCIQWFLVKCIAFDVSDLIERKGSFQIEGNVSARSVDLGTRKEENRAEMESTNLIAIQRPQSYRDRTIWCGIEHVIRNKALR